MLFFLYSFLGWCMEVTLMFINYHRFINRGFLIGPYCPIYGSGVVLVTVLNDLLAPVESSYGTSFLIAFIFCGILEYLTSYFFEKRFHARWWDYTHKPMNLNGRVWIGNLILFGLGGMIITRIFNPYFFKLISKHSTSFVKILIFILLIIIGVDYIISHFIMRILKLSVEDSRADNSEEIAKEVRQLLENKSLLHKRILDAYPNVEFRTARVKARLEKIKKNTEYLREQAEEKLDEINEKVKKKREIASKNLITTRRLQRNIIENQEELIKYLLEGEISEERKEELVNKIAEDKSILDKRDIF
ncbi:hypothetical protein [Lagierella sp.]|uniref:putative ABC transporter permease n=1 Tax=Lagierella sp. TaxID=2849657 RepID=UPI00261A39AE|nr:hypothetical protein [Lagierella sp.]